MPCATWKPLGVMRESEWPCSCGVCRTVIGNAPVRFEPIAFPEALQAGKRGSTGSTAFRDALAVSGHSWSQATYPGRCQAHHACPHMGTWTARRRAFALGPLAPTMRRLTRRREKSKHPYTRYGRRRPASRDMRAAVAATLCGCTR